MMTREQIALALAEILAKSGDQAATSELVTQISDHNGEQAARLAVAEAEAAALKLRNTELIEQNMKLFLRVGAAPAEESKESEDPEIKPFSSLFDENGNLK